MQLKINKAAATVKSEASAADMLLINRQSLRDLTPDEVYTFKVRACDDLIDRDFERFPLETLEKLAPMFVGRTMIADHRWTADNQRARIYETFVDARDGCNALIAKCYMLRNDSAKDLIAAIEGGILREVSVGCSIGKAVCSICGKEYGTCGHQKGTTYDGEMCHVDLLDPVDAYEMSFVAVPAQPGAGVIKSITGGGIEVLALPNAKARLEIEKEKWRFV